MHEYGITERLFQVALEHAQLGDGERLRRLQVALDPVSGYAPDAIRFYFEQLAKGTPAEGAQLDFEFSTDAQHIRLTSIDVAEADVVRRQFTVQGAVQGVGFRPFVYKLASGLGLHGWVRNASSGVEIELQGPAHQLHHFQHHLEQDAPVLARILKVEIRELDADHDMAPGVRILASRQVDGRTLISPDVATCAQCVHELFDPADRRHGYPFINCTHCGPRFTIIEQTPYDRPATTMARFPLCTACAAQYRDPHDRRFHAQPIACHACGPQIQFVPTAGSVRETAGVDESASALLEAAKLLKRGGLLAVKGIGGFHLACRADQRDAVAALRAAKRREAKPFAIMVRNVVEAALYCRVDPAEEALLLAPEAPIVLLRKHDEGRRALDSEMIAPANAYIGMMLPYTPLHHLLLQAAEGPLVMTSANPPGEPLCIDDEEARNRLVGVDGFLLHNRPIARRCDDSVMFVYTTGTRAATPQIIRRSRGLVPLPIMLPTGLRLERGLLATGADLKNVSALATDQQVFLTAHIGDLRDPETRAEQGRALEALERLFHIRPEAIVCDLHPDYAGTLYARRRAARDGVPLLEVQHHHAHIAGCMAEHDHSGAVIGLAFDGTGYGSDGSIWGGEALLTSLSDFERTCHLQPLPLPGGDAAVRNPDRIAYAYLRTLAPESNPARLLPSLSSAQHRMLDMMLDREIGVVATSSMGRLFDAASAILGLCTRASYEAQAAIALEAAALHSSEDGPGFGFGIEDGQVVITELLTQLASAVANGVETADVARRFHRTIAEIAVAMALHTQQSLATPPKTVALSGGVWQNRLLLEMAVPRLEAAGFDILIPHQVPANDGGIAYGQCVIAAARLAPGAASPLPHSNEQMRTSIGSLPCV